MGVLTTVPQELAAVKMHGAMRIFVGQGRRWSVTAISGATGIPVRTVESYRAGDASPSLSNYQSLCAVMGQAFFAATIEHMAFEVRSTAPERITPQKFLSEALDFSMHLSRFLEDGRIDHTESPKLKLRLGVLREKITALESSLAEKEDTA